MAFGPSPLLEQEGHASRKTLISHMPDPVLPILASYPLASHAFDESTSRAYRGVWTSKTWNPVSGCYPASTGCAHCYARKLAEDKRGTIAFPLGFDVVMKPHKLDEPRKIKASTLIFVNSMSDLFLPEISDEYRDRILAVIRETPRHTYQTLTKRPENAVRYCATRKLPANLWLGVSVEAQPYVGRVDELRKIEAAVRFLSIEPMLSDLTLNLADVGWVIVGGESGCHLAIHVDVKHVELLQIECVYCVERGRHQTSMRLVTPPRSMVHTQVGRCRGPCVLPHVTAAAEQIEYARIGNARQHTSAKRDLVAHESG